MTTSPLCATGSAVGMKSVTAGTAGVVAMDGSSGSGLRARRSDAYPRTSLPLWTGGPAIAATGWTGGRIRAGLPPAARSGFDERDAFGIDIGLLGVALRLVRRERRGVLASVLAGLLVHA